MLVRFDSDLTKALLRPQQERPKQPSFVTVMSEDGPRLIPCQISNADHFSLIEEAIGEIPDWLKDELIKGQIIVMGREDYAALPDSVIRLAEIMAP